MGEINLNNKKILYIGPTSFHYDKYLIKKLIDYGAAVHYYDFLNLYPSNLFTRIVNKIKSRSKEAYKQKFYNQILSKNDHDYVLVRQGYQLDRYFLEDLRKANSKAKFINFHWDSIRPQFDYLHLIQFYDKIYSFDIKDCQDHAPLNYLPLFYLDVYGEFRKNKFEDNKEKKYDVLFIGSWRDTERYNLIKLTENLCKETQLHFYHYLYFSFKNQIRSFKRGVIPKKAKAKKLSHEDILNLFNKTNAVIDFPSSFQTGLTIRTFETLGAGKKLITTNRNIMNEPFYNPEYIDVIDMNNFTLNLDFIRHTPSTSIEEKISNYSLGKYVNKLLQ